VLNLNAGLHNEDIKNKHGSHTGLPYRKKLKEMES
jgi:hypothetical protein